MSNRPVKRTAIGLAEAMFHEMDRLTAGTSTPQLARAKASVANTIISLQRLQMDYARFVDSERTQGQNMLPDLSICETDTQAQEKAA